MGAMDDLRATERCNRRGAVDELRTGYNRLARDLLAHLEHRLGEQSVKRLGVRVVR